MIFVSAIISLDCFGLDELERMRVSGELRKACSKRGATPQPKNRVNTTLRLMELRKIMRSETKLLQSGGIDAYIITSADEHQVSFLYGTFLLLRINLFRVSENDN